MLFHICTQLFQKMQLEELIPLYTQNRKLKLAISWTNLSKHLNRTKVDCKTAWRNIQAKRMKKGPFTVEEDAVIKQRVTEMGNKGEEGLWTSLEKELGRSSTSIFVRWKNSLDPKFRCGDWSGTEVMIICFSKFMFASQSSGV